MTPFRFAFDRASARRYDSEGRLHVAESNITKACVSPYRGDEIPDFSRLGLSPDRTYHLLRDPDELCRAAPTFAGIPIFDRHQAATAHDHPKDIVIGAVGTNVRFDDPWLVADLVFWPRAAIDLIESGQSRDLSCGYAFRAEMRPGTHRGEHFDGRMVDLVANHLALVPTARVEGAMVGDSAFYGGSTKVRHHSTFRAVLLAADSAVRRRRARDAEPDDRELDEEKASVDDLVAIIERWCEDLDGEQRDEFLNRLGELCTEGGDPSGVMADDRRRHARDREVGLFERTDPPPFERERAEDRRRIRAHDAAPTGIKPASERFANLGRVTVMGADRLTA